MNMQQQGNCSSRRNWSDIQPEVLGVIFKKLILPDRIRCGSVCKLWKSVSTDKYYTPLPKFPWLMLKDYYGLGLVDDQYWNYFSFTENILYQIDKSANVQEIMNYELVNPFSKSRIQIPHPSTLPMASFIQFVKVVVLADKFVVMLTSTGDLVFYKLGNDYIWNSSNMNHRQIYRDIIFYKEKLYVVEHQASIDIYNVDLELGHCQYIDNIAIDDAAAATIEAAQGVGGLYLVESCGDLLLVLRNSDFDANCSTSGIEVFKVELNCNSSPPQHRCIRITSLGDQVLFLGSNTNALSLSVEDFPGLLERNRIVFTGRTCYSAKDFGVYSLEDGSIKPFAFPLVFRPRMAHQKIWVNPTAPGLSEYHIVAPRNM